MASKRGVVGCEPASASVPSFSLCWSILRVRFCICDASFVSQRLCARG